MLKAKDYNVLYYFLKKKKYDRNGISYEDTVIRGNGPHCTRAWGIYDANRKRLQAYLLSGHATQYIYQPSNKNHNDNEKYHQ